MSAVTLFYTLPVLLVSVILHEIAHGKTAEALGDPTARSLGRITLNPIKHIDPFLTIILPGILILSGSPIVFGGAKPVPVNPLYFKDPRKGMALVAIAGPLVNLTLAAISYFILKALRLLSPLFTVWGVPLLDLVVPFLFFMVFINVVLAAFNMLPIPPLDGGRIVVGLLPPRYARFWARLEPYGFLILVVLLYTHVVDRYLEPIISLVAAALE